MFKWWLLLLSLLLSYGIAQSNPELQTLSKEFWEWRIVTQPASGDDIPRVERPGGWQPDFSP